MSMATMPHRGKFHKLLKYRLDQALSSQNGESARQYFDAEFRL